MNELYIVGAVLGLGLLVWSAFALNTYSENKYSYSPFNIRTILGMVGTVLLLIFGAVVISEPVALKNSLMIISIICFFAILIRISIKTNFIIGVYSTIIILIASIIIAVIYLLSRTQKKRR